MTYEELDTYGKLREIQRAGPFSMFTTLLDQWADKIDKKTGKVIQVTEIARRVKFFFEKYS